MVAPIVSYKHQRNENTTYAGAAANNNYVVYTGVGPGAAASPNTVPAGNKVYSVDVSVNFIHLAGSGTDAPSWMLTHLRADQDITALFGGGSGASEWSSIGNSLARNQVIKSYMSLIGTEDAGPIKTNVHIKIPKMWHRVREGDILLITFNADQTGSLSIGTRFKSYS